MVKTQVPDRKGPPPGGNVLVVGSVNIDTTVRVERFPVPGETLLGLSVTRGLGGKGANQAAAAARAGARAHLVATVGDDEDGQLVRSALDALGVATDLVHTCATESTGTAHITVDAAGQNFIVVVPGANALTKPARLAEVVGAVAAADVVVVQGEVPVETVAALTEMAAEAGVPLVLNLAPALTLPSGVLEGATVLVVNESEASALLGTPEPVGVRAAVDAAAELARRIPTVVLTVGALGAVFAQDGATPVHVAAPRPAHVRDTTGAGDALVGVLAACLARGATLPEAVSNGVRAATASVEHAGAAQSYPHFTSTPSEKP